MALEAQEEGRPEAQRRTVLPPALLVAASGRMVEMTADEYDAYRAEAQQIMRWKAQLSADAAAVPEPPRLAADAAEPCRSAPSTAAVFGCAGQKAKTSGLYDGHRPAMTSVPRSPAARRVSTSSKPAAAQASSHCASDRVVMWTPTFSGQSRLSTCSA